MKRRGWIEVTPSRLGGYDVMDWSEHHDAGSVVRESVPLGVAIRSAIARQEMVPHRKLCIFGEEEDGDE